MQRRVTADSLRKKSIKHNAIREHVNEIMKVFEQDASNAAANLKSYCSVVVPSNFDIQGITNSKAQLLIYNRLIEELESRGFTVLIDRDTHEWTIAGWEIIVDSELEKSLIETIASRTVQVKNSEAHRARRAAQIHSSKQT